MPDEVFNAPANLGVLSLAEMVSGTIDDAVPKWKERAQQLGLSRGEVVRAITGSMMGYVAQCAISSETTRESWLEVCGKAFDAMTAYAVDPEQTTKKYADWKKRAES